MAKPDLDEYDDASKTVAPNAAKIEHQEADGSPSDWEPSWAADNIGPPKTVVFDQNDEVLLEYFRHADGPAQGGALPDTPRVADLDKPQYKRVKFQINTAARIAQWAITEARRRLPHGPLNQAFHFSGDNPAGPPSYVMKNASPGYYETLLEGLTQGLVYLPAGQNDDGGLASGFEQLLANFFATIRTGAGVCANISALTAGLATLTALPTWQVDGVATTILRCSHNKGHSFAAIAYGDSPFVVADPWLAEPRLMLLEENLLGESGIKSFEKIVVHRRLDTPFGIPIAAAWRPAVAAGAPVTNLRITAARIAMADAESKQQRVKDAQLKDMRFDPKVPLFQPDGRANPAAKRIDTTWHRGIKGGNPFHANECMAAEDEEHQYAVWEMVTNDPEYDEAYWEDILKDPAYSKDGPPTPPIHTVDEWGEDAKHDFEPGTVAPPPGPPPKGKAKEVA